ncbi:MAG: Gldg family protein [Verrucomicrobia bacterium]|jgi:ABC-type uncharacterized transport system involved in gliding motility auxiliary subunit|nr:Gldg family protein [Verrucomicrobiota bacterium]OQC63362.1 MAG: ABC-type uncharacterized transport system [Verrucomicrobia bacterium ADurb.Bin006]MDI9379689.1 Gldg family protein [Verrucomicrobiota bacterium]NMD19283.1 hypothetical protein [Verrucomicrobiota bacterium]HNU99707.1 Gldg family protein [Verrucomicrobiota bacterium]
MNTNKHKWEPLLYSGVGVGAMFLILVAVGIIAGTAKVRLDLTADRVYTLSDGTKKTLAKLDTPVTINFYCTQSENRMPVQLKTYARRVEDLLDEYRQRSNGKIEIKKFDPQPDSDAEDSARLDGIEGQSIGEGGIIGLGEKVYLGLSVTCLDQKVALTFLDPSRERLLEYDLTRAIAQVVNPQKQNLGVMSGLPIFGQMMNPMMAQMGGGQQEPWIVLNELKRDFNVKQIDMSAEKIDDDINVLLVVHPSNISDKAQYTLDQFVLRGGKLIALLDPLSVFDSRNSMNPQNMMQRAASGGSDLPKLLAAWGIKFEGDKVIADKNYVTMVRRGAGGTPAPELTWLSLTADAINQNEIVTSQIDSLLLAGAGIFSGTPIEGLNQKVLVKTSVNSDGVDKMMAQFGADTSKDFKPSGKESPLALMLTGKFKTAFPDGPPGGAAADAAGDDKEKAEGGDAADKAGSLKESQKEGAVLLVGDTDFIYDQFCVQVQNFFGQKLVSPFNGNLGFLQNVIEQFMGDENLIQVRSRAVQNRPFTRVRKIQAEAEERYTEKIKNLKSDLEEAQQKINELQRNKDQNQRFILPPEVQAEIKRFREKEVQTKRDLKEVRRQLRKDIDALETRLKWFNIAAVPMLVTAAWIGFAVVKRKKTAAK